MNRIAIYQPREKALHTIEKLKKGLPHYLARLSDDTRLEAEIYSRESLKDRKVKVKADAKSWGKEYELEIEITSPADGLIAKAYPRRKITIPNPKEYARVSYGRAEEVDPEKLIVLVRKIIELKGNVLDLAQIRETVREGYWVKETTLNPEYNNALDEYESARYRKGYVATHPDEEGIPRNITTSKKMHRIREIEPLDKIRKLRGEELFEEA